MDRIIDSHVHLDLIFRHMPEKTAWFKKYHCGLVSWAFGEGVRSVDDLKTYLADQRRCIHTLHDTGLDCYYLAGIHPRNIPVDLSPEDVSDLLMPSLEDPLCLGIGEIGLETGTQQEKEMVVAQVEWGLGLGRSFLRIGLHTPRRNKAQMTDALLELLNDYWRLPSVAVVDHATRRTIGSILAKGYHAGVTLSPAKTSWEELTAIVSQHPDHIGRIMCNTDSGSAFFEDLVRAAGSDGLDMDMRQALCCRNAARFFVI